MFELEYENLQVDEKEKYSEIFRGNNICMLKGPNDSGKTTALSLIELAFSNFNLDKLENETMKNKLKSILNNSDFKMNLTISSFDNTFRIKIKYDNDSKRSEYFINNEPKGYTYFTEKIELLYEVPSEAIKKLDGILYDVYTKLSNYELKMNEYETYLSNIYDKLTEYENSEKTKMDLKSKIESLKEQLKNLIPINEEDNKTYMDLYDKFIFNKYQQLDIEISTIELKISELEKDAKKSQYQNKNKNKHLYELIKAGTEVYDLIRYNKSLLDQFVVEDQEYQNIFEGQLKLLVNNNGQSITDELLSNLNTYFLDIREKASEKLQNSSNSEYILQFDLIQQLINLLNQFKEQNPIIPVFDDTVTGLLNKLYKKRNDLKEVHDEYIKIDNIISACQNIINQLGKLTVILNLYNSEKNRYGTNNFESSNSNEDYKSQINILEEQKYNLKKEQMKIEDKYTSLNQTYDRYDLNILKTRLDKAKSDYEMGKNKIESIQADIKSLTNSLENLKTIEQPIYNMTKSEIEKESNLVIGIKKKLKSYKSCIDLLLRNKVNEATLDVSDIHFYDILGGYIASIIKFVYHLHNKYSLISIDFIKHNYIIGTEDLNRSTIPFAAIGTGTSALNGLIARMKQDSTKRLVILVDEIGDMDDRNLKNLIKNAEDEIISNKLLLMLMTRPEDKGKDKETKAICESISFNPGETNGNQ